MLYFVFYSIFLTIFLTFAGGAYFAFKKIKLI